MADKYDGNINSDLQPGMNFRDALFSPEMVIVPGGVFLMGSPVEEGGSSTERPQHSVCIAALAIGKYTVTFDEWDACVAAGGYSGYRPVDNWGRGRQPVIDVSWDDTQAYVAWLRNATGKHYRLLSEAEWEYAARAGSSTAFATGQSISKSQANFASNDGARSVGSYPANIFGLHDMPGNVWEWTQDCWNSSYDGAPSDGSAWISGDCHQRVARGGSWSGEVGYVRSALRFCGQAGIRSNALGFRVARALD